MRMGFALKRFASRRPAASAESPSPERLRLAGRGSAMVWVWHPLATRTAASVGRFASRRPAASAECPSPGRLRLAGGEREGVGLAPPRHAHRGKRWALRLARHMHRLRGDAKTTPVACLGHGLRCRRRGNNARGGGNGDRPRTALRPDARVRGNIYTCIIPNGALRGMRILLWLHFSAIVGSLSVYGQAR